MHRALVCATALAASFTALVAAQPARAITTFQAILTHGNEVPPTPEEGASGFGTFVLNDAMDALTYDIQLTGLDLNALQTPGDPNDNVTRTHIHIGPPGANGAIVFGQIDSSPTFQNDLDDLVIDPATGHFSGVWDNSEGNATTLAAQLATLLAGGLYFNVHTSDHAGGEIRGQIVVVPEPGTASLVVLGGVVLAIWRRRAA